MHTVRIFAPENPLARALRSKDGPTAESLIADADSRVAALADNIRAFVAERIALIAPYADRPEDDLFAGCKDIGGPAMNIAEVAEAAGLDTVGAVARGVCVMHDGLVSLGVWHTEALRIHLRALRLVGEPDGPTGEEGRRIVDDLLALRRSLGLPE
jgi:hypothetical protein